MEYIQDVGIQVLGEQKCLKSGAVLLNLKIRLYLIIVKSKFCI